MLSKIDLCSMALLKLGEAPIQSFTDDSASSKLARTLYDLVADSLLSLHPWRFATQEMTLEKNTEGNFIIPSNILRILKTKGRIIGNRIESNESEIQVIGVIRTAPELFPSYFISLLVTRLAMEFCIPLTGNQTVFRMLTALYETELQNAKFVDSTTSVSDALQDFSLVNSRF